MTSPASMNGAGLQETVALVLERASAVVRDRYRAAGVPDTVTDAVLQEYRARMEACAWRELLRAHEGPAH